MHAPRRLFPAAVLFVIVIAGFAAEVRAQALDSAGADSTTPVLLPEVPDQVAQAPVTLEPLQASALPTGVIEIHGRGQDLPVPLNQRVLSYVELFQGPLR